MYVLFDLWLAVQALGRDLWGAKAVNVLPSDAPQDVYSSTLCCICFSCCYI